ncbi:MAG: TolC family outer membrane protein [Gammaproteobacteria bacterium]
MLKKLLIAACAFAVLAPAARATDLWQVWQLATQNAPAFEQARANRNASMEARPLAWSKLFPSIDLSAGRTWNNGTQSSASRSPFAGSTLLSYRQASNTTQNQWGATLTQTLFNWQQFSAIQGADFTVGKAQADYLTALQGLMVSVSQAYFNVLEQRDILAANLANQHSLLRQFQQNQQEYKVGLIAITGVRQAEAAYEQARAQVILDRQTLAQAREALRAITGRYLPHLQGPRADLPLERPAPANVQKWVQTGIEENPALVSARLAQKIANNQVSQDRSGYMPSLNLSLQHTHASTGGSSSICQGANCSPAGPDNSGSYDNQIALQLSWNIFNGGGTRATVKQAQFQADFAMASQIAEQRTVEQNVRNAYLAVLSGIAGVQATKQAVASSQISLKATEEGLKVGTQTTIDVLTARANLLTAQKSFFNSRYSYLIAVLQLDQAAGTLTPADLKQLNGLLAPPGSAPVVPGVSTVAQPASASLPLATSSTSSR